MDLQRCTTAMSRSATLVLLGSVALLGVPAVVAQVGGGPACNKKVVNNDSVWDSEEGCEEWRTCDEDESCATIPGGGIKDCGEPTEDLTSYCQTFYGGSYDPYTGLCYPDENTQPGSSQPSDETHRRYLAAISCPQ